MDAVVVLPDHLHCLWTLPPEDGDFSTRWRLIKARFARAIPARERLSTRRARTGERGIWRRRFWEHQIKDERDWGTHVEYIHFNPVKHGHVAAARDWPHSSFHRFVASGLSRDDWAAGSQVKAMDRE
jgi:putative transposase